MTKVAISKVKACLCPPDRSPTLAVNRSSRPRLSTFSFSLYSARSLAVTSHLSPLRLPRRAARAKFSSICMVAAVPVIGSWKTRPIKGARLKSGRPVTSWPSITIEPVSTGQTPAMAFKVVDLPAPLPPITVTKSPSSSFKLTPFKACFSLMVPGLKVLVMLVSSSIFKPLF